ncbi:MAG: YncE family protein [Acidobacteriota bacterium]|nr:YncE family protein [Acidobacteriota bacterium]MDH3528386.1 YncE family protein [Acidobacteriota bacterium]
MQGLRTRFTWIVALVFCLSVAACAQTATAGNERLLVLNKAGNSLSVLNPDDFSLLGTVPVGEGPHEVVVSADGTTAYVTNYGARTAGNSLSIIDIKSMKETKRVDLGPLYRPHGIKLIGGKVYFSVEANNAIARYDPVAGKVDWIMGTGQLGSHMVVATGDERYFYTPNIGSDTVTMISSGGPGRRPGIDHIAVGRQPEAIDLSPDGKEVWVGLNLDQAIDVIDTATKKVTNRIKLSERPYRVVFAPDGKKAYATIFATKEVVEIDRSTKKILRTLTLENRAFGITFTKNGQFAFVTTIQEDGFVKIDLNSLKVVAKGTAGAGPDGIAVTF